MDPKEFEALMAKRTGKKTPITSDDSGRMNIVEETIRGMGRGAVGLATFPMEGLDLAKNISARGASYLTGAVTGADPDQIYQRDIQDAESNKLSPIHWNKQILDTADKAKESRFLKGSESVNKEWREGIKDPNWWLGHVGEAGAYTGAMGVTGIKAIKELGAKQIAILGDKMATKATKDTAKKELAKIAMKSTMARSGVVEGSMAHGDYRQWAKKNPEEATVMGDAIATAFGAVAGSVEGWSISKHIMDPFIKKFGREAGTKIAARFTTELAKELPKHAAIEGSTEGFQQIITNIGAKLGYDQDRDLMEGVVDSVLIGGVIGAGAGGIGVKYGKSGKNADERKLLNVMKSQNEVNKLKTEIDRNNEILANYAPDSEEYKKAEIDLVGLDKKLVKHENVITQLGKELGLYDDKEERTVTDEEAFGSVDPSLTIEEIADGIDNGIITKETWDNTPKEDFTPEMVEAVETHLQDYENAIQIENMASGKGIVLEEPKPTKQDKVIDGTRNDLWATLPEDYTDEDAIHVLNKDLVTFMGDRAPLVKPSTKGETNEVLDELSNIFGVRVVRVSIDSKDGTGTNGIAAPGDNNILYINDKAIRPDIWVFGHEFGHRLKKNNPDAYNTLLTVAAQEIDKKKLSEYQKTLDRRFGLKAGTTTANTATEEMLSDFIGDKFSDKKFWTKMNQENPTRFKEVITAVKEYVAEILSKFTGVTSKSDGFFRDMVKLDETLTSVMNEHIGYTGAIERLTASEVPTGRVTDLNKDNKHLTDIQLGEESSIVLRETKDKIVIKRLSRPGSRRGTGFVATSNQKDKGVPTKALEELKKYATENNKNIVAETDSVHPYLAGHNFESVAGDMVWRPGNDERLTEARRLANDKTVDPNAGADPQAYERTRDSLKDGIKTLDAKLKVQPNMMLQEERALLNRKLVDLNKERARAVKIATQEMQNAKSEILDIQKKIKDEEDVIRISTSREDIAFAKEQLDAFNLRVNELEDVIANSELTLGLESDTTIKDGVQGTKPAGDKSPGGSSVVTKGEETDSGNRDQQGTKEGKQGSKIPKLKDKITEIKQEISYKEMGNVEGELKRVTDKLAKEGKHGDPVAFMEAIAAMGADTITVSGEVAFQEAFRRHMMGEENDPVAHTNEEAKKIKAKANAKKKTKERLDTDAVSVRQTKEDKLKLAVLTKMLKTGRKVKGEPLVSTTEFEQEVEERMDDLRQEEDFDRNATAERPLKFSTDEAPTTATDINTKEFKEWFSKSKVVDKNNKPLKVYHATGSENGKFDTFDTKGGMGAGSWFSDSKRYTDAMPIDVGHTYEVYLSLQKPLDFRGIGYKATLNEVVKFFNSKGIETDLEYDSKEGDDLVVEVFQLAWDNRERFIKAGYDGVITYDAKVESSDDNYSTSYIAFHPSQIKSVYNRGTWDIFDGNVMFSMDEEPKFQSNLSKAIGDLKLDTKLPKKMTGAEWLGLFNKMVKKGKLNKDEVEFSFANSILEYGKTQEYTREEVLDAFRANPVTIESEESSNNLDDGSSGAMNSLINAAEQGIDELKEDLFSAVGDAMGITFNSPEAMAKVEARTNKLLNDVIKDGMTPEQMVNAIRGDESFGKYVFRNKSFYAADETSQKKILYEEYNEKIEEFMRDGINSDKAVEKANDWLYENHNYDPFDLVEESTEYENMTLPGGTGNYFNYLVKYTPNKGRYRGTGTNHWGKDNIIAHFRGDTFKVSNSEEEALMMVETQSDWHSDLAKSKDLKYVPNAPFKKSWPLLLFKHAMVKAYERGSRYIAWPSKGSQIAEIEGWYGDINGWDQMENDRDVPNSAIIRHYTQDLPKQVGAYVKQFGGKVEKILLDSDGTGKHEVLAVKITPKMEDVVKRSQVMLFSMDEDPNHKEVQSTASAISADIKYQGKDGLGLYQFITEDGRNFSTLTTTPEEIKARRDKMLSGFDFSFDIDPNDPNPEVQKRLEQAGQTPTISGFRSIKDLTTAMWKSFTSPVAELRPGKHGFLKDRIRLAKEVDKFGSRQAYNKVYGVIGRLDKDERQVFTMNIVLNDIMRDTMPNKDGVSLLYDGHLPFGYKTTAEVRASLRHFREQARKSPRVMQALANRRKMMMELQDQLIDGGWISEKVRGNDSYFHHQTIEKLRNGDDYVFGMHINSGNKKLSWAHDRGEEVGAYSTDYVVSEFSVISDAIALMELHKIKEQIRQKYDITDKLNEKANGNKIEVPKGYVEWSPSRSTGWGMSPSYPDALAEQALQQAKIDPKILKQLQIAKGMKDTWIIPERIANVMGRIRSINRDPVPSKVSNALIQNWKKWVLINPMRVFRYNLNNMSGDVDIAMAYDWRIMKYTLQSMKDIAGDINSSGLKLPFNLQRYGSVLSDETKAELETAHRLGALDAGFVMHEITDAPAQFENLMRGPTGGSFTKPISNWWQGSKDATNYRENILRLASYRYFKDRLNSGDKNVYGASNPTEIDEITNLEEKAAKLSRELIGDYGNLTEGGQWMRKHMVPFYSWIEINSPRYFKMMRNLKSEEKDATTAAVTSLTWKGSVLGAKFLMFTALVNAWNMTFFGDEEDELEGEQARKMHLILGRRADGSIRYVQIAGAFKDMLSMFAAEDTVADFKEIASGEVSVREKLAEAGWATPAKLLGGARPFTKMAFEFSTGLSLYPDPFNPRPIRDKFDHIAKSMSLELITRWARGQPTRGVLEEFQNKLYWNVDPGESAYYHIRDKVRKFNKKVGYFPSIPILKTNANNRTAIRSNALSNYKLALKYADMEAAAKYLKIYKENGGRNKFLSSSYKLIQPTGGLRKRDKGAFYKTLSDHDKEVLNRASKWHRQTYRDLNR